MPGRQAAACLLISVLVFPVSAADSIGIVLKAQNAQGRAPLAAGDNVFSGDTLSTGPGGSLQISLPGTGVLHVGESSRIRLTREGLETKLEILANSATFCLTTAADASQAQVPDKVVQSVGEKASLGEPSAAKPQSQIRSGRTVVTLQQGQCVVISLSEKLPAGAAPSGALLASDKIMLYGTVAAIIIAAVALGGDEPPKRRTGVSPSRP